MFADSELPMTSSEGEFLPLNSQDVHADWYLCLSRACRNPEMEDYEERWAAEMPSGESSVALDALDEADDDRQPGKGSEPGNEDMGSLTMKQSGKAKAMKAGKDSEDEHMASVLGEAGLPAGLEKLGKKADEESEEESEEGSSAYASTKSEERARFMKRDSQQVTPLCQQRALKAVLFPTFVGTLCWNSLVPTKSTNLKPCFHQRCPFIRSKRRPFIQSKRCTAFRGCTAFSYTAFRSTSLVDEIFTHLSWTNWSNTG